MSLQFLSWHCCCIGMGGGGCAANDTDKPIINILPMSNVSTFLQDFFMVSLPLHYNT